MRFATFALLLALVFTAGCGNGDDDAVEETRQVRVRGIEYTVLRARPLNVHDQPDDAYYRGAPPGAGRILLAAFLTACNVGDARDSTTDDLLLVDQPFETKFHPESPEPANPFAYRPTQLDPGECFPASDSAAEQGPGASLVIFDVPRRTLQNRPLQLAVDGPAGEAQLQGAKRIRLDL